MGDIQKIGGWILCSFLREATAGPYQNGTVRLVRFLNKSQCKSKKTNTFLQFEDKGTQGTYCTGGGGGVLYGCTENYCGVIEIGRKTLQRNSLEIMVSGASLIYFYLWPRNGKQSLDMY